MFTDVFIAAAARVTSRAVERGSRLLALLLIPFPLAAQTAGSISGRVTANGTPVVGAFILLDAGSRPLAQTDTAVTRFGQAEQHGHDLQGIESNTRSAGRAYRRGLA